MQIQNNAQLRSYHTFGINQHCHALVEVHSVDDLIEVYQHPEWQSLPKLMLGKGSNMLFTAPFEGVVIVNRLGGIEVSDTPTKHKLHISGGEDWPSLVKWCVEHGYAGIENLALIPGCSGSAPIQNIGAYGIELKDVCSYVDYLCLESLKVKRLTRQECQFGYRDSIFKHALKDKAIVTAIGIELEKQWQPNLSYGPLQTLDLDTVTPKEVFDVVVKVRQEKLPDPAVTGNAGSFFKNPIISHEHYTSLKASHDALVAYPAENGMKLAAGWLIDQCGLKGHQIGGAMVHPNQALVLVNHNEATAEDVVRLAAFVRQSVLDKFGVELEHEVRFMGASHEVYLKDVL
ncbi:UDP-N-acetylmuramate dehydrogenase [Vibrio sp. 10N]|uniref:UDP-N-acetylmuramate dehydrogenase n=1 Tax=Vibrio sp. 10N TaxID=3058938 RepID=UPI002813046D|nr:UDP-N-acetylmuramate dehydrogenase [Vibrio sp. 10N]